MKRALVTGGSGTLGRAMAMALAESGHHVYVQAHHNPAKAASIIANIKDKGGSASLLIFDVTDEKSSREVLEPLVESTAIQVVVHNAGIHLDAPLVGMTRDQWDRVIDVSLHGFYNITQPLLMPMIRSRWGRIISIASVAALTGNRGQANYAAAKAGLVGASKSLALELASRNILVNVVAPGIIESAMAEGHFTAERLKALVPMQRAGHPEDVAHLVAFLASDKAAYITGQVISVNGGMI